MNAAAETLLGVSCKSSVDKPLAGIVALPDGVWQQLDEARRSGQIYIDRELVLHSVRDHRDQTIDCVITPIADSSNLLLEIFDNDRQSRIAQEQRLLRQQQQSQNLLRSLAHEILNPLGGIRGAAQLLDQDIQSLAETSELREYTELIMREADRLQGLLHGLLGPRKRPAPESLNIHDVLEHVARLMLGSDAGQQIHFQPDYDPSIPNLHCDREQMTQVLVNLFGNAIRALQQTDAAQITARTRIERNFTIRGELIRLVCKVSIIDNGPGVPEDIRDSLLYPLVSRAPDGSGLGLSIAQSLVVQQGGLIEYYGHGGNTVFEITLPIRQAN